jgi:hypothetical protein
VGYQLVISCLAMAIQVRRGRKHARISHWFISSLAPQCLAAGTPGMDFDFANTIVYSTALVLGRLLVGQETQF